MGKRLILLIFPLILLTAIAAGTTLFRKSETLEVQGDRWQLPKRLREASGLAVLDENYLLTHNDEQGLVYRLNLNQRAVEAHITVGAPPIADDYEGIAVTGDAIFLVNSKGTLYQMEHAEIAVGGQGREAIKIETGAGEFCEIEGLHHFKGELLLPCKTPLTEEYKNQFVIFGWHLNRQELTVKISLPMESVSPGKTLYPTAIDVTANHYYVLASRRLVVIDSTQRSAAPPKLFKLPKKIHPQPEGLALLADGSLVIVEDRKSSQSTLAHYKGLNELELLNP